MTPDFDHWLMSFYYAQVLKTANVKKKKIVFCFKFSLVYFYYHYERSYQILLTLQQGLDYM